MQLERNGGDTSADLRVLSTGLRPQPPFLAAISFSEVREAAGVALIVSLCFCAADIVLLAERSRGIDSNIGGTRKLCQQGAALVGEG